MKEAKIKGLKICYLDEGEGETVLLLHGWGACKESLSPIYNYLKQNFRIVALDLPGFGKSDEPSEPWDVSDYVDFLKEFMSYTGLNNPYALGHSNGGRILIKAAAKGMPFKKLILVDSAGIKPVHKPIYYIKVYTYKAAKKVLSLPLINKTGVLEALQSKAGSQDYKNSSPIMKATMSKLLNEDLTDELKNVKAETLLIWGENDTATPLSDGQKMEKEIKGSGLVVLKGAGHFSYLDCFDKFIPVVDYFLNH
ncbi:MAG: alpha/beta hydrolase [Bacillota bacterium]|nr:alpha/beta hydrolase [Bacillota bacterium]